jgi:hypothetical protein
VSLKILIYTSWARPGLSARDVDDILGSARTNNPLEGITGVLIFNGTAFMQILEGGVDAIDALVRRLAADRRHSNMSIRDERPIEARSFPTWEMAYLQLRDGSFVGEEEVRRALERDLPDAIRNIARGVVHNVMNAG